MRTLLLAAILALSPLDGIAGDKQIVDVKELAGRWRGWGQRSGRGRMVDDECIARRKLQSFDLQWHDRR